MRYDGFCGEEICYKLEQCKRSACNQCQVIAECHYTAILIYYSNL